MFERRCDVGRTTDGNTDYLVSGIELAGMSSGEAIIQ